MAVGSMQMGLTRTLTLTLTLRLRLKMKMPTRKRRRKGARVQLPQPPPHADSLEHALPVIEGEFCALILQCQHRLQMMSQMMSLLCRHGSAHLMQLVLVVLHRHN